MLRSLFARLLDRSPRENLQALRAALKKGNTDFMYDLDSVMRSSFHMDARRPIDRLYRYQRILKERIDWREIEFEKKTVVEIGCGPLLGWGPIAAYLGCERYVCFDPRMQLSVVTSDEIARRYFLPMFRQLEALYGRGLRFEDYRAQLLDRIEPIACSFSDVSLLGAKVDLVFSNNVLQHIHEIDDCLKWIRDISATDTHQLHIVHFTDHESPPDRPFEKIYTVSPDVYLGGRGLVNLKRPSELKAAFERHGLEVEMIPYVKGDPPVPERLHPFWHRFTPDDLAIEIAFYTG